MMEAEFFSETTVVFNGLNGITCQNKELFVYTAAQTALTAGGRHLFYRFQAVRVSFFKRDNSYITRKGLNPP
jgi:hypothetical protein